MRDEMPLRVLSKMVLLASVLVCGLMLASALIWGLRSNALVAYAAPIDPPQGYPKLSLSAKTADPVLVGTGGAAVKYLIEIQNTGAYTAYGVTLQDTVPLSTTYKGDAWASNGTSPVFLDGVLNWVGTVGFDSSVWITFSVEVSGFYSGVLHNTAIISHPLIADSVAVEAETTVTDFPLFSIEKHTTPEKPGANKPLTYWLKVTNLGQPVTDFPITVIDQLPANTTFASASAGGTLVGSAVTWSSLPISLDYGESTVLTFTVNVGDVFSGTVISNLDYSVSSAVTPLAGGEVQTTTIIDPILSLWKNTIPDPPGSNRDMIYVLSLFNRGSLATGLVITDRIPSGVTYVSGGTLLPGGIVQWNWPSLDTYESAQFSYTVSIGDVAEVDVSNPDYRACSAEGVCQLGMPITSTVYGPTFEAAVEVDPLAKGAGGGDKIVTSTITIRNVGPGDALAATAKLIFERVSVGLGDLKVKPVVGTLYDGGKCGDKCVAYYWVGDLAVDDEIVITALGDSSIGGAEGTIYSTTVIVTDTLSNMVTDPVIASGSGKITHYANLIPYKTAPAVIGNGQIMTYTLKVWNSGYTTDASQQLLTDTIPLSTTLVSVSHNGESYQMNGRTVVSWTLPSFSTGDTLYRWFSVQVDQDLVSGTLLVNDDYRISFYESQVSGIITNTGEPVTTTVKEVGLIDSYKTVNPSMMLPGEDNELTYQLHIVNSGGIPLYGVQVYDSLPWQHTTYQRDAVASAGTVISDIVSVLWSGDVPANSSQIVTFTVVVDPYFEGAITNTAVITHPDLRDEVEITSVAYISRLPVLQIYKTAPSQNYRETPMRYRITVFNMGQLATDLVITDALPSNLQFIAGSATAGGQYANGILTWHLPLLDIGESATFEFQAIPMSGQYVVNDNYRVVCSEGVSAVGPPVYTRLLGDLYVFLPLTYKQ